MASKKQDFPEIFSKIRKNFPMAFAVSCAVFLTACGTKVQNPYGEFTLEQQSRRFPIHVVEGSKYLDIPIYPGREHLGLQQREMLHNFLEGYRERAAETLTIHVPENPVDEMAAHAILRELEREIVHHGVSSHQLVYKKYRPGTVEDRNHTPIILTYEAVEAVSSRCGAWSTQISPDQDFLKVREAVTKDFGCSSQRALASMVAHPEDLEGPRQSYRPRSSRRAYTDYKKYIAAEDRGADIDLSGSVSDIGAK